jgi:hypothetical protein
MHGTLNVQIQAFLPLALNGSGQIHAPAALPAEKNLLVPTEQEAVYAPEPVRSMCGKHQSLTPAENRFLGRPIRSQSLYRLCYGRPDYFCNIHLNPAKHMQYHVISVAKFIWARPDSASDMNHISYKEGKLQL